ncbi:MAG: 23S rRNA (adenine(2030)-N(6))-methyltransferase RlmJ, partial [Methylocapsa sp.]|nr:23S rRNA (adenine(2030)-N(6))-methyltransferase RlmJ [Methylocapsa sp.]
LCELQPQAFAQLKSSIGADRRAKLFAMDGYMGLRAFIPPPERRGLVLVDPPYEKEAEWETAAEAVAGAWRKWAAGVYVLWYPVKDNRAPAAIARIFARRGVRRTLRLELQIGPPLTAGKLARCGMILINPPFRLAEEAKILLPWLALILESEESSFLIDWLSGE